MSAVQTLLQIFTEPGKAMESVRERSMILLPLALLVLGTAAMQFWYYQAVDFPWLQEQLLSANPDLTAAQIEQSKAFMTHGTLTAMGVIGSLIMIPLILLVSAVYYLLAAKVVGSELGFGKWFAFSTWTSVPTLLILVAMAAKIVMSSNGQIGPNDVNPLTLNALIFHMSMSSPWSGLLNALNLTTFWSIAVAVIGYVRWTGKSTATSLIVVLLPYIVIFGGWAAVAASMAK